MLPSHYVLIVALADPMMRLTPLNSEVILQPVAAKDKVQPVHRLTAPFVTGWVRPCR
jgi:hypothetical protein